MQAKSAGSYEVTKTTSKCQSEKKDDFGKQRLRVCTEVVLMRDKDGRSG